MKTNNVDKIFEIYPNVYIPNVIIDYAKDTESSVIVDGLKYSRTDRAMLKFNSIEDWKKNHDNVSYWKKSVYDFSFLNIPIIEIWDYSGFNSNTIIDAALGRSNWSTIELLTKQEFYDFDRLIDRMQEFKTVPTKHWTEYPIRKIGMIDKTKIDFIAKNTVSKTESLCWLYRDNCITIRIPLKFITLVVPLKYFLTLNISGFPLEILKAFNEDWIEKAKCKNCAYLEFNFPKDILSRPLSEQEKIGILVDFLNLKIKTKKRKNYDAS